VAGVLVASLVGLVFVLGQPHVDLRALQARAAASVPLLRDSVGRSGESKAERDKLLTEGKVLYARGDLLGIGPGRTAKVLATQAAPYVKEAHDDYLATLLERGVLGALGLVVLVATVTVRLSRVVGRPLRADYAAVLARPEMLAGACAGMLLSGVFYEVLHFRHLWALFGLIAATDLWGRRR
jgi:O-antigen ligase